MKTGRPKKTFTKEDIKTVETFGKIRASFELMGEHFGCSSKTIQRRMQDPESDFCLAYKKGFSETKAALAKKQIEVALGGNTTMLIWLGKQYLGQKDKEVHEHEIKGTFEDFLRESFRKHE